MLITVEISKRLVLINSISSVVSRLLKVTVLAWLYQYLLKRISPDEFAVYALVMAIMIFAPLFSTLFTSGISRYVVEACASGDTTRVKRIISSILPVLAGWAGVLVVFGMVFAWNVDHLLNVPASHLGDARWMLILLLVDFAAQMVMTPYTVGFHVRQRFILLNLIQIGGDLVRIGLLFGLMLGVSTRVLWVVMSSVGANFIVLGVTIAISRRLLPLLRFEWPLFDYQVARELLSFGWWSTVNHLAYLLYINADIIVLNKLSTSLEVSNFKLGSEFYLQIQALVNTAIATLQPALTAMHAQSDVRRLGSAYLRGCRYCLWITMLMAAPLIVYGHELIRLYVGEGYLGAGTVMILLLLLLPFVQTIGLLSSLATATARIREFSLTGLVSQLIKLAVTLYVVGRLNLGAQGCASSTLAVIGLAVVAVYWPLGLRLAHVQFGSFARDVLWRGTLPAVVAIVGGLFLKQLQVPGSWVALGSQAALCCLLYTATLLFCLGSDERNLLVQSWRMLKLNAVCKL